MRLIGRVLLICLTVSAAVSCGGSNSMDGENIAMDYFSGGFVYFADAARFHDCATGVDYPVSQSTGYLTTERRYMGMNPNPGERISVEFRGHIEQLPPMEGDGTVATMVIDTLIGFDRTVTCNPNAVVCGLYESSDTTNKETLKLKPDYTFTRTRFLIGSDEVITEGVWGLASALELVLKPLSVRSTTSSDAATPNVVGVEDGGNKLNVAMFQIIPDQQTLSSNDGYGISSFKKVFI